jgi:hypothetical protein
MRRQLALLVSSLTPGKPMAEECGIDAIQEGERLGEIVSPAFNNDNGNQDHEQQQRLLGLGYRWENEPHHTGWF